MPDDFNFSDYLVFIWWLIKVTAFVVSITLNVIFFLLLLELR